jgi:hypothetical protein
MKKVFKQPTEPTEGTEPSFPIMAPTRHTLAVDRETGFRSFRSLRNE